MMNAASTASPAMIQAHHGSLEATDALLGIVPSSCEGSLTGNPRPDV